MEKTPCSTGSFGGFIRPISGEIGMVFLVGLTTYHISQQEFIVDTTQNEHPILRDSSDISTL